MNPKFTIGYAIHNKAHLLLQIIDGIKESFDSEDQLIFVFDNCTDNSIDEYLRLRPSIPNPCLQIVNSVDGFEIKANNQILRNASNDVIILFQDDMICHDPEIKNKIVTLIRKVPNLGLMGGRSGYELESTDFPEKPVNKISNWEHKEDQFQERLKGNLYYAKRTFLNRGPLVFTRELINIVGYLDEEYYPQSIDDLDYCARAAFKHGLQNVVFECEIESKLEWGATRRKDTPLWKLTRGKHVKRNWDLFCMRWWEYFDKSGTKIPGPPVGEGSV